MTDPRQTSIRDLLSVLRAHWVLVVACAVLAVGAALGSSLSQDAKYTASAKLSFQDQSDDLALVGTTSGTSEPPAARALREANTLLSAETLERARQTLTPTPTIETLRAEVTAAPENTSNLVVVTAMAPTAREAAALANAVATTAVRVETQSLRRRFSVAARDLQKRPDAALGNNTDPETQGLYRDRIGRLDALASVAEPVTLAATALPPGSPSSPKPVRSAIIAGFAGLLVGIGMAFLRHSLDRRFRGSFDVRSHLDLPLLGYVSQESMGKTGFSQGGRDDMSAPNLEAFRIVRANLGFLSRADGSKVVLVTSALPQEGKSTVASTLAFVTAVAGRRTLLVECDFRRPSLAKRLEIDPAPGLIEILSGDVEARDVVRHLPVETFADTTIRANGGRADTMACIPAGGPTSQAAELIGSERLRAFLTKARDNYDVVILDSAPLLPVVDTLELFPSVDAAIFCVRDRQTTRDEADAGRAALAHIGERPIGIVITGVTHQDAAAYGYYAHAYSYSSR